MLFLMQSKEGKRDLDSIIFEKALKDSNFGIEKHLLKYIEKSELKEKHDICKAAIPVGDIDFVAMWAKEYHNIQTINPIEIPIELRTDEFLKRDYKIITAHDIPKNGTFFLKDVSELKRFSFLGNMADIITPDVFQKPSNPNDFSVYLNPEHLYSLSTPVHILSEYRVYVFNKEIAAVAHYDGDPLYFPDRDLIRQAVKIYSASPDSPNSYTMDFMVTPNGTALIEVHNFSSCGLYCNLFDAEIAYAYKDGIDWILNKNKKIEI